MWRTRCAWVEYFLVHRKHSGTSDPTCFCRWCSSWSWHENEALAELALVARLLRIGYRNRVDYLQVLCKFRIITTPEVAMSALENVGDVMSEGTETVHDMTCVDYEVMLFVEACGERDKSSDTSECC
ncbi:hypothetical protein MTO96_043120 [Rhipicephalus appendiculatus]